MNEFIITGTLTPTHDARIEGWVSQPDSRGTMDIVWTCVVTTFLCTFTTLCLNCPSRGEELWGELWVENWTYRHAFFANMGGFELNCSDCPPFRVNSKHIRWLVKKKYISPPEVSDEELWDKSRQDTLTRTITCLQAGYMVLGCIGRSVQGLAITTLEFSTVAVVACSLMTSICWLRKPLDVRYPVRIRMDAPMAQVLREAGPLAARPYRQTPLDFIDDYRPSWALHVHTFTGFSSGDGIRPLTRIGDSKLPWLTWKESSYLLHLAGWNYSFPTHFEELLWRISSYRLLSPRDLPSEGGSTGSPNAISNAEKGRGPLVATAVEVSDSEQVNDNVKVNARKEAESGTEGEDEQSFVPSQLPLK
ncbi:hypothetical protein QBC36DRAFT_388481 [Triangularia setosa]|uniref:Uncharacterized protein n=1 Tax=Triangularia setosa TaxID=2587417 RepID=A0AAN6W484_9PEZI|nr:hypothetical protein QBC36DRAFT_388481 [Podospora setosa]